MNKKLVNKKVIKALTLGLSLAMASQPITAMAAEDNGAAPAPAEPDKNPITDYKDGGVADAAEEAADTSWVETKKAEAAADSAVEAVESISEINGAKADEAVVEASNALEAEMTYDASRLDAEGKIVDSPEEDIRKAAGVLDVAESFDTIANEKAAQADAAAETTETEAAKAETLQTEAETIVNETEKTLSDAKEAAETSKDLIDKAGTVEEAQSAYDDAEKAVKDADDVVKKAESRIFEINNKFEETKTNIDEAQKAYNELSQAVTDAETSFDDNREAAVKEAAEAKDRLDALKAEAEKLEEAAKKAQTDYMNAGHGKVASLEKAINEQIQAGKTPAWTGTGSYDELFDAIVQYYIVPDVFNGEFVAANWDKKSGDYFYENNGKKSSQADVLNCYNVTYKDKDGNQQTIQLNYKLAQGTKTDKNWPGLVIFEKTGHDVIGAAKASIEATDENLAKLDGQVVEYKDTLYTKGDDGKYYMSSGNATENVLVSDNSEGFEIADGAVKTEVSGEAEVSYSYEDGKFLKTVKKDVTTTTYTGTSLEAQEASLESEDAAKDAYKAALQDKIDNLNDGESLVIGDKEFNKGDTADLTGYESETKDTVTVKGTFCEKYTDVVSSGNKDKYKFSNGFLSVINEQHAFGEISKGKNADGTYTVEYVKAVKAEDENYSMIADLFSLGISSSDLEKKLSEKYGEEGKVYVGMDAVDFKIGKATVFIADNKEAEATGATADEALANFNKAMEDSLSDGAAAYNVKSETGDAVTTYGYKALECYIKTVAITRETVSESTLKAVEAKIRTEYRNDKWYEGNILLSTYSKEDGEDYKTDNLQDSTADTRTLDENEEKATKAFRNAMAAAPELAAKYAEIADKAGRAKAAFAEAQTEVNKLSSLINEVKSDAAVSKKTVSLQASLDAALAKLNELKTERDSLLEELESIATALDAKIAALTPAVTPSGEGGGADEADTTAAPGMTAAGTLTGIVNPETPAAGAPITAAAPGAGGAGAGNAADAEGAGTEELTNINDGRTALASVIDEETAPEVTAINEGKAPLTYAPINEESMSWWWWLIVALLGATGYAMYKKHQEKKAEKVTK